MTQLLVRLPSEKTPARPAREGMLFVGLALVWGSLGAGASHSVTLSGIGDFGLAPELPIAYWAALIALNVTFAVALRRQAPGWALAVLTVTLIVVVIGAAAMAVDIPRGEATFRHAGIVDSFIAGIRPDGNIDAYYNWPGYFTWLAMVARAAGLDSVLGLGQWAPVVTVVVWAALARNVFAALGANRNLAWIGVWLFVVGNWIDQDYLSPQGFGYGVYLALILLAIGPLSSGPALSIASYVRQGGPVGVVEWWAERQPLESDHRRRLGALVLSLVLIAGLIPSHQLTPFAIVLALGGIAILGRSWAPWLPLVVMALLGLWFLTGAENFLDGHPLVQDSTDLENAASANVVDRLEGTQGREFIVRLRILFTAAMWMLAVFGAVVGARRGLRVAVPITLSILPLLLVPMQTYGGEMLMRAALFALPFVALLMAALFVPHADDHRLGLRSAVALAVVASLFTVASVTARYGNAAFDMFTQKEVNATQAAIELAPDGALMVSAAHPTPWRSRKYIEYKAATLQDLCKTAEDADACFAILRGRAWEAGDSGLVLIVTSSTQEAITIQGLLPPGMLEGVTNQVLEDPSGELAFGNKDAVVLTLNPAREASIP